MNWDRWPFLPFYLVIEERRNLIPRLPLNINLHMEGAVEWLLAAQKIGQDDGIPAYYDLARGRWAPSYPETTGYTVPTMFACSASLQRPELHQAALCMADYLLEARAPGGGVGHWKQQGIKQVAPVVFDTGQVIFGWLSAWRATNCSVYLQAAMNAADWLVQVQSESGAWIAFQHLDTVKVIDTRVAWALLELSRVTSTAAYERAARRNLDWAITQQQANGWFQHASFRVEEDPVTHTIAYTAEGLLESGLLLDETRYIAAAEQVANILLEHQQANGSLPGTFNAFWLPTSKSSCLTGNCQVALLWLRLYNLKRKANFLEAARRAIAFVAACQNLVTSNPGVRGAIGGSYPIYGRYLRFKYPNWAAKFFIDALLALRAVEQEVSAVPLQH